MDTDTDSVDRLNKHIEDLEGEIELLRHTLNDYISNHDLIEDLDSSIHQEEVDRLLSYECGEAMRLTIVKMDQSSFSVIVYKSATVNHLKLAIRDTILRTLPASKTHRISWKSVWRNYCLQCEDGRCLLDNRNYLKDFSVHDNSVIHMVSRPIIRREKRKLRASQSTQGKRFFNPNLLR